MLLRIFLRVDWSILMQVRKKYKLELSDFINYTYYAIQKNIIFEIVSIVVIAFGASYFTAERERFLLVGAVGALIAGIIMIPIIYYSARKRTVKHFESYAFADEEIESIVDKKGFSQNSSIGHTKVPFNKLYKVCEAKHGIYVYVSSRQAIILAKRHFTEDEINTIKTLFSENMPKKKVKFK